MFQSLEQGLICPVCRHSKISVIKSYKHLWFSCLECQNVYRQRRPIYPLEHILPFIHPENFHGAIKRVVVDFFRQEEVMDRDSTFYDYYADCSQNEKGKWSNELQALEEELASCHLSILGKKILDLSGGPGFFAKGCEEKAAKVYVTEFSSTAAEAMKNNLGVNAVKFDYNNDQLEELFEDKFDLIFIRWSVNFCTDLEKLVLSLGKILNSSGAVYISYVTPTLGCCVGWQFDDYTYNVLYTPETVHRVFEEHGFKTLRRYCHTEYKHKKHYYSKTLKNRIMGLYRAPFLSYYLWLARLTHEHINKENIQRNYAAIFTKKE